MKDPVRDELDFYLEERTRELVEAGVEPAEARRRAEAAFGDRAAIEADLARVRRRREARTRWAGLGGTVRQAVRALARRPGYAATVVATLALGIGATTAIFSAVDAVLLEAPPFAEPERLVSIWESDPRRPRRNPSPADFLDLRRDMDAFARMSAYDWRTGNLLGTDRPETITFADVSADLFHTLGVAASVGRTFGPDAVPPGARVAVLSHGLWTRRFGADPAVVGRTLRLDEHAYEILGVAPEGFDFPEGAELWTAAAWDVPGAAFMGFDPRGMRDAWYHRVVARLAPGVSLEAASDALAAKAAELASTYPDTNADAEIWLAPLTEERVADVRSTLLLLLGATGLILLIVCANVANLVLVQAAARRKEWAVRRALGAPRGRIVGQVFTECLVLAGLGAAAGVALAAVALEALRPLILPELPGGTSVDLDAGVLAFSMAMAALASLLFGTLPAWSAASASPGAGVDRGAGARSASRADRRLREGLVAAEVALAVVLVLTSGLLLRSLAALHDVDLGFRIDGLTTAWVGLPGARDADPEEVRAFYGTVREAAAGLPGVSAVAWTLRGPLALGPGAGLRIRGVTENDTDLISTRWQVVSPGYFDALGVRLVDGRVLVAADGPDAEPVGVVNETLARRFFPGGGAVGSLVNTGLDGRDDGAPRWVRVVGVVADTKNRGPGGVAEPVLFRPLDQPAPGFRGDGALLVVRAEGSPAALVPALRQVVADADPDAPVGDVTVGADLAASYLTGQRLVLTLLGGFAALALILGALGVYGVARYAVARRTREIGVRMALGAGRGRVAGLVVRQGLRPAAVGVGLGLLASAGAVRLVSGRLYEVGAMDPLTWAVVPSLLLVVAAAATWLPARRAASVAPVEAIRVE